MVGVNAQRQAWATHGFDVGLGAWVSKAFGGFQLLGLIITQLKSHMTCYNPMPLIELKNNKLHELSPPGGSVSPPSGFSSLFFDQGVP